MGTNMMDTGWMVNHMDKENFISMMVHSMKETGFKTNVKDMVYMKI